MATSRRPVGGLSAPRPPRLGGYAPPRPPRLFCRLGGFLAGARRELLLFCPCSPPVAQKKVLNWTIQTSYYVIMGIPVDESPGLVPTPNECWVNLLMPEWVWMVVTGVQKGNIWQPFHGEPYDFAIKLWRINFELYQSKSDVHGTSWWRTNRSSTAVYVYSSKGYPMLTNSQLPPCTTICPNGNQSPEYAHFFGGTAEIWSSYDGIDPGYKSQEIEELLQPDDKTFFEPARSDNNIRVARYARHRDGTRVYIRRTN